MPRIFISYRRDDSAGHAGRLFDRLQEHFDGDSVVMDIETIEPGEDFVQAVLKAAGSSDAVIVLMGSRWLTITDDSGRRRLDDSQDMVRLEIRTALEHKNVRVIPTLVGGAVMPNQDDLPDDLQQLARLNAFEISDSRFDYDIDRLIESIGRTIERWGDGSLSTRSPTTSSGAKQRLCPDTSPKYYVYVSDAKVDMLYSQIPSQKGRALAAELNLPSGSIDSLERETGRYSRLRVVVRYIDQGFDVGTVDDPGAYFRGVHEMRWGPYGQTVGTGLLGKSLDAKIVYFGGSTETTHFGLGGGLHHVIGNHEGSTPVLFHSSTPYLVSVLADELRASDMQNSPWWSVHRGMMRIEDQSDELDEVKALIAVMNANKFRGPRQRLEFLAKRLLYRTIRTPLGQPNPDKHVVLLGSPIYVALADEHMQPDREGQAAT